MSELALHTRAPLQRFGLKGPAAGEWLIAQGIALPIAPNTWTYSAPPSAASLLIARLGSAEFFLEHQASVAGAQGPRLAAPSAVTHPAGVYPVAREDWAFLLSGDGVHDVLAQVCNIQFAALDLTPQPVIMTLMSGVAVLVVGEDNTGRAYRIWCDPTFGPYLEKTLATVVIECGGTHEGEPW